MSTMTLRNKTEKKSSNQIKGTLNAVTLLKTPKDDRIVEHVKVMLPCAADRYSLSPLFNKRNNKVGSQRPLVSA